MEKEVGELCLILSCPAVVISSTGPASALHYSSVMCLGEYLVEEGEERDKWPVYRQKHTVATSDLPFYLYR